MADRGFREGPVTPMSVQLGSYEANAAALLDDTGRATAALDQADMLADLDTQLAVEGATRRLRRWPAATPD
jgi:hypothetical protein